MLKESVDIAIEGFTGPLDMLCHLVESKQMQASKIKMTQIVRIYGAYLSKTRKASVETLAEFFFMVANLLLHKTLSLLPSGAEEGEDDGLPEDIDEAAMEEEMRRRLERYRPYRAATAWLEERKTKQERYYRREAAPLDDEEGEARYDIGDLYFLSRIWWGLLEKRSGSRSKTSAEFDFEDDRELDGIPTAPPEEFQIQARIAELEEKLTLHSELSLNALWAVSPNIRTLVVTILAVLEMCRMGKTIIEQEALFADVKIRAKR